MIKASEGGGGKGVRMANNAEQVGPMYRQARHARARDIYRGNPLSHNAYPILFSVHPIPYSGTRARAHSHARLLCVCSHALCRTYAAACAHVHERLRPSSGVHACAC
eukprot:6187052-Pleurochrysis_carterae.AAC.1